MMKNNSGSIMVLTIFMISIMAIIITTLLFDLRTELRIAGNINDLKQVEYIAESGIIYAAAELNKKATQNNHAEFKKTESPTIEFAGGNFKSIIQSAPETITKVFINDINRELEKKTEYLMVESEAEYGNFIITKTAIIKTEKLDNQIKYSIFIRLN
jgi:Tfp pilus assembly protein PilX